MIVSVTGFGKTPAGRCLTPTQQGDTSLRHALRWCQPASPSGVTDSPFPALFLAPSYLGQVTLKGGGLWNGAPLGGENIYISYLGFFCEEDVSLPSPFLLRSVMYVYRCGLMNACPALS